MALAEAALRSLLIVIELLCIEDQCMQGLGMTFLKIFGICTSPTKTGCEERVRGEGIRNRFPNLNRSCHQNPCFLPWLVRMEFLGALYPMMARGNPFNRIFAGPDGGFQNRYPCPILQLSARFFTPPSASSHKTIALIPAGSPSLSGGNW